MKKNQSKFYGLLPTSLKTRSKQTEIGSGFIVKVKSAPRIRFLAMFRRRKAGQNQLSQSPSKKTMSRSSNLRVPTLKTIKTSFPYPIVSGLLGKHRDELIPCPLLPEKSDLEIALENGDCSATIEHLLQNSKRTKILHVYLEGFALDVSRMKILERVLSYIEKLDCRFTSYPSDGLIYLFRCLKNNDSVKELRLLQLPSQLLACNVSVLKELQSLIQANTTLKSLTMSIQQPRMEAVFQHEFLCRAGNDNACFHAIQEAFSSMQSKRSNIQILELVDFHVQSHAFCNFLAIASIPETLKFRRFRLSGPMENSYIYKDSPIRDLTMTGCAMAPECSSQIVEGISELPLLKNLTWCAWKHVRRSLGSNYERIDMTSAIVALLNRGIIESITSLTSFVHVPVICLALAKNGSLKVLRLGSIEFHNEDELRLLKILENGNTVLEDVTGISSSKLNYYCQLNKYGRGKARDETTSKEDFVDLLCYANDCCETTSESSTVDILYGLMKEVPSLWCQ